MKSIMVAALLAGSTFAASITSGTISVFTEDVGPRRTSLTLVGADFSITMGTVLSSDNLISLPPICFIGTCTYDFTQLASLTHGDESVTGHVVSYGMSVTYHGVTYEYGSTPYTLALSLQLTGPSVTVPVDFAPSPLDRSLVYWTGVPFTASGTFAIMNGSTVILSDTLTGSGTAGADDQIYNAGAIFEAAYSFQAVPEPAAFVLVASGLAAIGATRRRAS